jgi:hypothetical protein
MPPYPYSATESLFDLPVRRHMLLPGVIGSERTTGPAMCFARLAYGFNVSLTFALLVTVIGEGLGVIVGALLGYFGGKLDILGQRSLKSGPRFPSSTPIILSAQSLYRSIFPRDSALQPSFWILVTILSPSMWMESPTTCGGGSIVRRRRTMSQQQQRRECPENRYHVPALSFRMR